ncbi:hypothetical protein BB560_001163 [Smittium megazygosporum]|uniref:CCHC-type domain-containing protein n=1 Tax=Smittium megazygosporum TaxID=133381 RepID=A0A2T9ZIC4_9FUNG|nr:hypothetical protein BB560_001163 [Smittium megazygosporum]
MNSENANQETAQVAAGLMQEAELSYANVVAENEQLKAQLATTEAQYNQLAADYDAAKKRCKKLNADNAEDAIIYNSCKPEEAVTLFKLWLQGDAAGKKMGQLTIATNLQWGLEEWIAALTSHFSKAANREEGSVTELAKMRKPSGQSWADFNTDFVSYVQSIQKELYIEAWLSKCYLAAVANSDRELWNYLSQSEELIDMFKKLSLAVLNNSQKPKLSEIQCYVCGEKGHISKNCYSSPLNQNTKKPPKNDIESPKTGMIATFTDECNSCKIENTELVCTSVPEGNKRIRIENLIDSRQMAQPRPMESRLGASPKKKKLIKVPNRGTEFTKRLLSVPAPITLGELYKIRPKLIEGTISALRGGADPQCYIVATCREFTLSALIDTGASYSLINSDLASKLGISPFKLKKSIHIQPVQGREIEITHGIDLDLKLGEGLFIKISAALLEDCAVPLLIGMDALHNLKGRLYYDRGVLSIKCQNVRVGVQLYSRKEVKDFITSTSEQPIDSKNESEKVGHHPRTIEEEALGNLEELSESEDSGSESDEESVGLFYAAIHEELRKMECPIETNPPEYPPELKELLEKYNHLFPGTLDQLKGIRDSNFRINLVPEC